jgi:hypothetical protein
MTNQQAEKIAKCYFTQQDEVFYNEIQHEEIKGILYLYFETTAPDWWSKCKRYYSIAIQENTTILRDSNVIDKSSTTYDLETTKKTLKNRLIYLLSKTI